MNAQPRPDRNAELALGLRHHAAGRLDDAARLYQQLYAADRRDSEVLFLMGVLCCDLGLFDAACQFLDEALAVAVAFPEARRQLVVALNGSAEQQIIAGKFAEAQRTLDRAQSLLPDDAATLQGLGRIALSNGDAAAAEAHFVKSLSQCAQSAHTLNWLGLARLQLGRHAEAEANLRQALHLEPELNQARNNLGLVLYGQGRAAEAAVCFEAALARDPAYTKARINLGVTLRLLGRHDDARSAFESVLAAHPAELDALNNLGVIFQDLGDSERALHYLTQAIAVSPTSPAARWNLALTQLLRNDFKSGWANYEARWDGCDHLRGTYAMPRERAWRGEDLHGKRLLLWTEQGLGDTLQFIRFARDVAGRGAHVSVLAPRELAALISSAPGVSEVLTAGGPSLRYDVHAPLMSLPYQLGVSSDAADLHGSAPYLRAAPDRVIRWRERLLTYPALRVGLVWAGNARRQSPELMAIDARRSLALASLAPIMAVPGCSFFSLQKGAAAAQLSAPTPAGGPLIDAAGIHDFSAEWADFADTAAFVANLDLIISVDTAVVHLAGALGKPVWLLNRYDNCWRWLEGRDDSPWYATLRQFRQRTPGDWQPVIAEAAAALSQAARLAQEAVLARSIR
jgi:tetratricopeptide (TPR) repeat protein